ncbi:unnamed protein product [Euphydryas editha]|uniref:Reverse transcriptase domain-containing protein n=1 Tax=Euphydryas editha TaxID=104508 RepID=A0AAU9VCZ5_EUPED|nr:unnamed protein product [Euphydryas editha]
MVLAFALHSTIFLKSVFVTPTPSKPIFAHDISHRLDNISRLNVTSDDVLKVLQSLDISKGPGCDGVPAVFLRSCAANLALPLSIIFRKSLEECTFPKIWKMAQIIPIHKKGSRTSIENYRPISILNIFSKLFEKIIYNRIYPTITRGLPKTQHGSLKGRSTSSNLALFLDYVLNNMEGRGQVDVIYTDFEKAFDRVDHDILLLKLEYLGIHGDLLRWVRSYLTNRSQAVVLGGYRSDYAHVPSGVPRGSHLGPLFYNAYIFDIHTCFSNANHILYADDKKIYMRIRSASDCELIQNDLNKLYNYYNKNRIIGNIEKCQYIIFTRKKSPIIFPYHFNGHVIERVEMVRNLGVIFDAKMLMTDHISSIVSRSCRNLGFIIRTCQPFRDAVCLKVMYYAHVRSVLEYASSIWSPFYRSHISRIESVQRRFVNHLNKKCHKHKSTASTYVKNCRIHNLLTLEERRQMLDLCFLYDVIHGRFNCPELIERVSLCVPTRRTRHTPLFYVPTLTTNYGKNAVFSRIVALHNKLFSKIDLFIGSKYSYKNNVKSFISKL